MPRKAKKTEKPPLPFLEHPVRGVRLQNVPEVRAALNPKEFFTETQNSSSLNSWVRPEFDRSVAAALPVKRGGRKKCLSATSILDNSSQLSRKKSVCQFPSLSFHTRSRDQSNQQRSTHTNKSSESPDVCETGNQPQGACQIKRTAKHSDTPKRQTSTFRKRNVKTLSNEAASSSRCLDPPENPSIQVTERCSIPADGDATPASKTHSTTEVSSVSPPPDVDTPKVIQEGSSHPSSSSPHLLQAQPCTPPCNQLPEMLVADTPERDYGLKVTWRKRRGLMLLLKERGHLSDSDVFNHS
ncbi:RAD9, HUS1, RAD1-interacting nuclear orphan protein 1 [Trematomus bernacchii]|uniref:RAD9, HUS1, RAD1-interacting nuclear orphan protein 1 n=1 Tax=Trematomus bernacchii TaxID=40690 RepID=UPI00146EA8E9|nr:RAD9, HUS1, RAD1-interacting nuclear orphan protein 1 [Trematomus bernacchii]XP_033989447.1 RAD9, HUS1, RAD1-interacting nuclear orphan protein 1 [Trematomus bernacchii]